MKNQTWMITVALTTSFAGSALAITPEDKCEADKNKIAGKYAFCRQKAEAKAIKKGEAPDYSKCDTKLLDKWAKAEQKAIDKGTTCVDSVSDTAIQNLVTAHADGVANALAGGSLPAAGSLLATGQTQCDQGAGTLGPCPGSPAGQDGSVGAGTARSYTDNGDGTITDNVTGLMWEKLSDDGDVVHDKDLTYTWYTAFTNKIASLNAGGGFAGYTDWRLPNVMELESLRDFGRVGPSVDPAFDSGCTAGCSVFTCSCTRSNFYWSSTTYENSPDFAWGVYFGDGFVDEGGKSLTHYVRAVRGGS